MTKVLKFYETLYYLVWGDKFDIKMARACRDQYVKYSDQITFSFKPFGDKTLDALEKMFMIKPRKAVAHAFWKDLSGIITSNRDAQRLFEDIFIEEEADEDKIFLKVIKPRQPKRGYVCVTIVTNNCRGLQKLLNAGRVGTREYDPNSPQVEQIGPDIG
jgi:hypothetical protein